MKQIKLLEIQDFREVTIEVVRAYYLRQPIEISKEVIDGEASWNVEVNHTMYALGNEDEQQVIREFLSYYNLDELIQEEEVTIGMIPMQVFSYGEYYGDIEDDLNYHTSIMGLSLGEIAVAFYEDYMRVLQTAIAEGK